MTVYCSGDCVEGQHMGQACCWISTADDELIRVFTGMQTG